MSGNLSVSEQSLGLTQSELVILRHQTEVALQTRSQGSAMAERGRGTSRHSQASSRAASASSNQSMQRVTLDSNSIVRIEQALDRLVYSIMERMQQLDDALAQMAQDDGDRVHASAAEIDREIARTKRLLSQHEDLDLQLESVKKVCRVVRNLRLRCDDVSARLDRNVVLQILPQAPTARAR